MAGALGVNQRWLFTAVFALGAALAGLGGALAIPREPANLEIDLALVSDAFVVVVVGGLGSIPGAFLAALLIARDQGVLHRARLLEAHAGRRVHRHGGGAGAAPLGTARPAAGRGTRAGRRAGARASFRGSVLRRASWPRSRAYRSSRTATRSSCSPTSSSSRCSPSACTSSSGRAAWCRSAMPPTSGSAPMPPALLFLRWRLPMELALLRGAARRAAGAALFGWFCVRLSGIYLAMLTLALAQIVWSVAFQWDALTGGSNGLVGVWPAPWLASRTAYYYVTLALCARGDRLPLAHRSPRPSATRCARAATRRCARKPSASTCAPSNGRHSSLAGTVRRARRRAVRLLQGLDLARDAVGAALGGRPGDGAARRRADPDRPGVGRGALHLAGGRGVARDRLLARRDRRGDPAPGARVSARHRRRAQADGCSR